MNVLVKRIISFSAIALILAVLIVANILGSIFSNMITAALCGTGVTFDGEGVAAALAAGDELCEELMDEGIVLFKNENNALPLDFPEGENAEMPINLLGWAATDMGFLLRGIGSGSSTINKDSKVTLLDALAAEGFKVNPDFISKYTSFRSTDRPTGGSNSNPEAYTLIEPAKSSYSSELLSAAKDFSKTAVVVFSRNGGENRGEIPSTQPLKHGGMPADNSRTYLQISKEEDDLLDLAAENFDKVIVIINTANTMHLEFLRDDRVDAAFFVGLTGQSGTRSIAKLLKGEINPSGKTSDIYTYSPESNPSWANREEQNGHIQYVEDIYYGYKWYETAHVEGVLDNPAFHGGLGYDGFVQYPFGYGLSFTEFEWTVDSIDVPKPITKDSIIEIEMAVKNVGEVTGKDVIQVYYTPPYTPGKIEKAHVNLVAFAKTADIAPGQTQQNIKLSFSAYDMASYDCYDKNGNGFAGYELDSGKYQIKIMRNSHTVDTCEKAVTEFTLAEGIKFEKDPVTGKQNPQTAVTVKNQFTGATAYAGVPIDGSTVGAELTYMSREDFLGTFPNAHARTPSVSSEISKANNFRNTSYDQTQKPTFGYESDLRIVEIGDKDSDGNITNLRKATKAELDGTVGANMGLKINHELVMEIGLDYDHPDWEKIVDQISYAEAKSLVEASGFRTEAMVSVGKPRAYEFDGPAGFNENTMGITSGEWTAYPSQTLIGCTFSQELAFIMGLAMGNEASVTNLNGWYAPGVNLHRSAYTARNFEYYGEDGVHSGKMAAMVIKGAKANGLYCYIKHYALSEPGPNPKNLNTWATEQNLRENYLRPFEIAVKEGGANALMTAFNRVGGTWAGASYPLNVTILREEWGFRGTVITDWSTGDGYMNPQQGVRAGNDIWLNPNDTSGAPLRDNDFTDMYCAKMAAKNVLYTYTNTYAYASEFDWEGELEKYKAELGVRIVAPVFAWWIILLVVIDVAAVGALGFWAFTIVKPMIKERKKDPAQSATE